MLHPVAITNGEKNEKKKLESEVQVKVSIQFKQFVFNRLVLKTAS